MLTALTGSRIYTLPVRKVAAAFVAMLVAAAFASSAFAHAEPARITPGDGAVLTSPPVQIAMTMTQDMERRTGANDIDVFGADGAEVTTVAAAVANGDRRSLSVAMPSRLEPGVYTVKWKTVSADDGDASNGQFSFTYDPNGTPSPGREQVKDDPLGTASATAPPGGGSATPGTPAASLSTGGDGTSWVLVTAVAIGMFVAGGGTTFLLYQRRT